MHKDIIFKNIKFCHILTSVSFERTVFFTVFKKADAWVILSKEEQSIKQKIEKAGIPLKNWDIQLNYGIKTGFNEAFIIDGKTKDRLIAEDAKSIELIKPLLKDDSIKKWAINFVDKWLITTVPYLKINIDDYMAIKNHLLKFGQVRLEQSGNVGSRKKANNKWFETQDTIAYYDNFEHGKIIWKQTSIHQTFTYDDSGYFLDVSSQLLFSKTENLKYILAILNSKVFFFWIKNTAYAFGEKGIRWIPDFVNQFCIPKIACDKVTELETIVNQILTNKKLGEEISHLEIKLNQIVANLYELDENEKKMIGL